MTYLNTKKILFCLEILTDIFTKFVRNGTFFCNTSQSLCVIQFVKIFQPIYSCGQQVAHDLLPFCVFPNEMYYIEHIFINLGFTDVALMNYQLRTTISYLNILCIEYLYAVSLSFNQFLPLFVKFFGHISFLFFSL